MNNPTFVNYRRSRTPVELEMEALLAGCGIDSGDQRAIDSFLAPLQHKGPVYYFQYQHSIRVALLGDAVARLMHLDRKILVYSGLLHDIGKAQVPAATLGKTSGWTDQDTKNMLPHVMDSYRLIRDRFDFTAEVILWHHKFQKNGYPKYIPEPLHDYCLGIKVMIPFYGRLLSLCDQFDAFHRVNDKLDSVGPPTGEQIKDLMFHYNQDQKILIKELYDGDVFTTHTAIETGSPV